MTALTQGQKIEALEQDVRALKLKIEQLYKRINVSDFVPASKAAEELGCSTKTLYEHIKHAKAFPKESKYQEGVHWKQRETPSKTPGKTEPTIRYFINVTKWSEV